MEDVKNFIITKHENDTSFYKNKIMTKQIGDIKISEEAINDKKSFNFNSHFYNWIYFFNIFYTYKYSTLLLFDKM